jgi:hypothetical protein
MANFGVFRQSAMPGIHIGPANGNSPHGALPQVADRKFLALRGSFYCFA